MGEDLPTRDLRPLTIVALAALSITGAYAAAPEKDKAWDALLDEVKKHGGVETVLDRSASYVFQRPDGSYVTFTRLLAVAKRSVCLISKDQHASVCIDWDSGKTNYGDHADAASPWRVYEGPSVEETAAKQPGPLDALLSWLTSFAPKHNLGHWIYRNSGGPPIWTYGG
jgi:hypothetical protein